MHYFLSLYLSNPRQCIHTHTEHDLTSQPKFWKLFFSLAWDDNTVRILISGFL